MKYESYYKKQFNDIKTILKKRCQNIKYFSFTWFKLFLECYHKTETNFKNGVLKKCYEPIFETKFYINNSCAYCEFLCIFYEFQKEAR